MGKAKLLTLISLVLVLATKSHASEVDVRTGRSVTSINWSRFTPSVPAAGTAQYDAGMVLLNNARYNYSWAPSGLTFDSANQMYVPKGIGESQVRPGTSAVMGEALVLKTGLYDLSPSSAGFSKSALTTRTTQMIKGLAYSHVANKGAGGWGNDWQTALWAAQLGHAAYMMWDDLDSSTQSYVSRMIENEANRFVAPGYKVPYWNGAGGDSKAEENSWNAMVLQDAVAMMPDHVQVNEWRRAASELMASSFAKQSDLTNTSTVDGKPVKDWIKGYNVRADGVVINHNIIHPDYMTTTTHNTRSYITQSLAGQVVPESAGFNADVVWRGLTTANFPTSAGFPNPGGTMYREGQAPLYYPQGNDWSYVRYDIFYGADAYADVLGYGTTPSGYTAKQWMAVRAAAFRQMQSRFTTGQVYAPGEWVSDYSGKEQQVAWELGDGYLIQWLAGQNKISLPGNWNSPVAVDNPGFERVAVSTGARASFQSSTIPGWRVASGSTALAGVRNLVGVSGLSDDFDTASFNGNHNALYVVTASGSGGTAPVIAQTLAAALAENTRYDLTLDAAGVGIVPSAEEYLVQLLAGGRVLAELDGRVTTAPALPSSEFVTLAISFDTTLQLLPSGVIFGSSLLELRITNPITNSGSTNLSPEVIFDNIRFNATPVPEPVLGALSIVVLAALTRGSRRVSRRRLTVVN